MTLAQRLDGTDDLLGRKVRLDLGMLGCEADTLFHLYHVLRVIIIRDQHQQPTSGVGVVMAHVG